MKYNIFVVKWPLSIQYLNMGIEYKIIVMGSMVMDLLIGTFIFIFGLSDFYIIYI